MFEEFNQASDTDPAVEQYMYQRLARMTPGERLDRCLQLCSAVRALALAGIHARYPAASEQELRKRFAALTLGREFSIKHFNWDPESEGY